MPECSQKKDLAMKLCIRSCCFVNTGNNIIFIKSDFEGSNHECLVQKGHFAAGKVHNISSFINTPMAMYIPESPVLLANQHIRSQAMQCMYCS